VLVGLDGWVTLRATSGTRVVPAADFFEGAFTTARRPDELVTSVTLTGPEGRSGWLEQARRPGDFALVGVFAALATTSAGEVSSAAIALSGVAGRPVRAEAAEAHLVGRPLRAELVAEAAALVPVDLDPPDDVHATAAHRRALAEVLTARLLGRLAGVPR
jgi:carbon-monoxide dehydrogenase medium subunit